ncbi:MAG: rod shape-determining protein MreD [Thioalkalivibrionaceae bacterium]
MRVLSIVAATLLLAILLSIMAWPSPWHHMAPMWTLLVLIYWATAFPRRVGVLAGFATGLILDALQGSTFGVHAIPLALGCYIAISIHSRMRLAPVWQQAIIVLLIAFLVRGLELWLRGALGAPVDAAWFAIAPLTTALLWPVVFWSLRSVRRSLLLHLIE